MTSTLGVLDLGDLIPGGSGPDGADSPSPARTNDPWTVLVDDSVLNIAAPAIPVSGLSGISRGAGKLPDDDGVAAEKREKLSVVSDDVSRSVTSLVVGVDKENRTSIVEG